MMSVAIAMSVDYNLFILSRWHEEKGHGKSAKQATIETLVHAGQSIQIA